MPDLFLQMKHVSKRYVGVQALDDVEFAIAPAEIHCLVGENGSGKSTLIKIISGSVRPDPGAEIWIDGAPFHDYGAIDTIHKGIEVIPQDLSLFPNLTAAENIGLSQVIASGTQWVNWQEMNEIARRAMARIGVSLPLDAPVGEISVADQQIVAICRALTRDVRLVIMDEPTSSLTRKEVDALLALVKDLQAKGIATLFVSHKLNEVLQVADRVTVLRDGRNVGTFPGRELDDAKLGLLMTGKVITQTSFVAQIAEGEPLLEVRNLSKAGNFRDISFRLQAGEIVGITGLLGSGRTELALALFGINPADSGEIRVRGQPAPIRSVQDAIRLGIGYVPENRLVQGLVMPQSVSRNVAMTVLPRLVGWLGLIDGPKVRQTVRSWVDNLAIKVPSTDAPVQTLSGGNQQRVVLARWLATSPAILILDGPTIGIDVAAKSAIHEIIHNLARQGIGIILITDEVPEAYYNCTRVLVMQRGRIIYETETAQSRLEQLQERVYMAGSEA